MTPGIEGWHAHVYFDGGSIGRCGPCASARLLRTYP